MKNLPTSPVYSPVYAQHLSAIASINAEIEEQKHHVTQIENQIKESEGVILDITNKLIIERREIAQGASRLARRTMTIEQFDDHVKGLKDWESGLSELKTESGVLNEQLTILRVELAIQNRGLLAARSEILTGMLDQAITDFAEVGSEPLQRLILAIIAKTGKSKGYTIVNHALFAEITGKIVFDKLLPHLFSDGIFPDLNEANAYIDGQIKTAA